jgi:hypothetical protein
VDFRAVPFLRALATLGARVREVAGVRVLPAFLEPDLGARFDGISTPTCVAWLDRLLEDREQ